MAAPAKATSGNDREPISGSAQQSVEGRILGGFLESDEFGLSGC
jgi:hypothetical protein